MPWQLPVPPQCEETFGAQVMEVSSELASFALAGAGEVLGFEPFSLPSSLASFCRHSLTFFHHQLSNLH
jgi:hypothetical protein